MSLKYGIKISILSEADGGGYFVEVPDLPGCASDGDTIEEAMEKIKDAIDLWIEVAEETGKNVPEPKMYKNNDDYSGKLTLRMPKDLHKELDLKSEEQGVSINQLILYYVSKGIGKDSKLEEANEIENIDKLKKISEYIINTSIEWSKRKETPQTQKQRTNVLKFIQKERCKNG